MLNKKLTLLYLLLISVAGCDQEKREVKPTIVSDITRVLMHEPNRFTFLVQHPGNKIIGQLIVSADLVDIVEDLKKDEFTHIECICKNNWGKPATCNPVPQDFSKWTIGASRLTIHLHSAKEINGSGWNHGKFGSGQTVVIE